MGLPRTFRGYDPIWIVVDQLTKSVYFLPIKVKFSLKKLAKLYIGEIMRLHGTPMSIVSDRDTKFVPQFWKNLDEAMKTKLEFSTASYPQIDSESERTIQILKDMLRACVIDLKRF